MTDIHQKIAEAFFTIGRKHGYKHLPPIGGILSTTFSHPVFAMPHIKDTLTVDGFNTAFRPNDNDEGTHLVAFEQYYICTNQPFKNQFDFIREIILSVIKSVFPTDVQLEDITIEQGPHEWHADSTGYKGGGGEINITSIKLAGKQIPLGKLELAQINDYDTSGGIKGNPCHLIVFGINRFVNFYAMVKAIKEKGPSSIPSLTIQDLYLFDREKAAFYKGLAAAFLSTPDNSNTILKKIDTDFLQIENAIQANDFSLETFNAFGRTCLFVECAYATNIITRNVRKYFIRQEAAIYKKFAENIVAHPDKHIKLINQSLANGEKITQVAILPIENVVFDFIHNNFVIYPRTTEQPLYPELITEDIRDIFRNTLGIQEYDLPQIRLKETMFVRAVGNDLAKPVEDLTNSTTIYTSAGTIAELLERITILANHVASTHPHKFKHVDMKKLTADIRYLALDWQYFSIKKYPKLQGILGGIALTQQGYSEDLAKRVQLFHTATKTQFDAITDPGTQLLLLVGQLDDIISLYTKSIESEKNISNQDPFGIRQKLRIVITLAKKLQFTKNDLLQLLEKAIEINSYTTDNTSTILTGYIKNRIEEALR